MSEPAHIDEWNNVKNRKSQRDINKEIGEAFGPKKVREYEENGVVITVYEAR